VLDTHGQTVAALFLTPSLEDTEWFASSRSWWFIFLCFHHRNKYINSHLSTGTKIVQADEFQLQSTHLLPVQSLLQQLSRWFTFDSSSWE